MTDYIELHRHLENGLGKLAQEIPLPMGGFARLHKKALADGVLRRQIKELMALAISIAVGCEGCIAYHTHDAVGAGAERDALLETIVVALMMGGGPAVLATFAVQEVSSMK